MLKSNPLAKDATIFAIRKDNSKWRNPMNKKSYLHLSIGAFSLLLIDLVLAMPADANIFTCRASALRVITVTEGVFEPAVANPAEAPCKTDDRAFPDVSLLNIIKAEGIDADTVGAVPHTGNPSTAEAKVVEASLLGGVVKAGVVNANAKVAPVGGVCKLSSSSSIATLAINGVPITVGSSPLTVTIPLVGVLHLNETINGVNKVTQRAVDLVITNLLLQTTLNVKRVIVSEAIADFTFGNPCSVP
jgi:hypothetical protein